MKHAKLKLGIFGGCVMVAAVAVLAAGRFGGTEKNFQRLLEQDGTWAWHAENGTANTSHGAAAQQWWRQWRLESAFKKFLSDHPNHARAMVAYANFLTDSGRHDEAIEWLGKAIVADPKLAVAYNNLANFYGEFGRPQDALHYYQTAFTLEPDNPLYRFNWATTCYLFRTDARAVYGWDKSEIFRRCLTQYRTARDLAPENYGYASAYAETFFMAPDPDWQEAYVAWQFCLDQELDAETRQRTYSHIALVCMKMGRLDEAKQWLEKMDAAEVQGLRSVRERKLAQLLTAQAAALPVAVVTSPATAGADK